MIPSRKCLLLICVFICSLALLSGVLISTGKLLRGKIWRSCPDYSDSRTPQRTFRSFINALADGQVEHALKLCTVDGLESLHRNYDTQKAISDEPFTLTFEQFITMNGKRFRQIETSEIETFLYSESCAAIHTGQLGFNDGFLLRKIDNRWFLDCWDYTGPVEPSIDDLMQ